MLYQKKKQTKQQTKTYQNYLQASKALWKK